MAGRFSDFEHPNGPFLGDMCHQSQVDMWHGDVIPLDIAPKVHYGAQMTFFRKKASIHIGNDSAEQQPFREVLIGPHKTCQPRV